MRGFSLLLSLSIIGCAHPKLSMRAEPRTFTENDYEDLYEAWTREEHGFSAQRLEGTLHVTATLQSPEFRWAYVVRYAHDLGLTTEERAEMLRTSLADAEERHRFFVTLTGQQFRENDLTRERSAWRVLLVDEDGRQLAPVEIERVRRPTALERAYFPSVSPFRHAFRIAFPTRRDDGRPVIGPSASSIILRFTGPLGRVDIKWKFDPALTSVAER